MRRGRGDPHQARAVRSGGGRRRIADVALHRLHGCLLHARAGGPDGVPDDRRRRGHSPTDEFEAAGQHRRRGLRRRRRQRHGGSVRQGAVHGVQAVANLGLPGHAGNEPLHFRDAQVRAAEGARFRSRRLLLPSELCWRKPRLHQIPRLVRMADGFADVPLHRVDVGCQSLALLGHITTSTDDVGHIRLQAGDLAVEARCRDPLPQALRTLGLLELSRVQVSGSELLHLLRHRLELLA
mmetsp:Transcript_27938/g.80125  ORF Transcript_27938/g.80125 Transcript_27938/m.80125 type:complete len:238 (+) Transcript_27938:640-1353(+)